VTIDDAVAFAVEDRLPLQRIELVRLLVSVDGVEPVTGRLIHSVRH
jgi:hypothetical protein